MAETILTNVFCMTILLILLFGILLQKSIINKSTRNFSFLILSASFYLLCNLTSEFFEGKVDLTPLSYVINVLAYFAIDLTVISFCFYLYSLIENSKEKKILPLFISALLSLVRMLTVLILTVLKKQFLIIDGHYSEGELFFIPYILSFVVMTFLFAAAIMNRKSFTKRQLIVIIIYLIMPIVPIVLETFIDLYSLTGVSITASILLIYVLIQAVNIERSKIREAILEELSTKDQLTKLNNRRAYYRLLSNISPDDEFGVIFCDINGLKYTNDHFGHSAGDVLITDFADLLRLAFEEENIFRISGDEFVIISKTEDKSEFEEKTAKLRAVIEQNKKIGAMGATFGKGCCIEKLLAESENLMYSDKKEFYIKNPTFEMRKSIT